MMQGAMRDLWGAIQTGGRAPATAADPSDQLARMRAAFDRVLAQVQEVSQLLLKVQGEALAVLNDAAAANAQALGGVAPNFAEMQKTVIEAMQNASRQVTTAIDEMRKRMTDLQEETRQAMGTARGAWRTSRSPARRIRLRELSRRGPKPRGGGERAEIFPGQELAGWV